MDGNHPFASQGNVREVVFLISGYVGNIKRKFSLEKL
jgi:hypothetical protein